MGATVAADLAGLSTLTAAGIRAEFAVELGRLDQNVSAPKTLTAATLATLFDDSDASQQLSDFFGGLIDRFDDVTDIPVTTIAAATIAQLVAHPDIVELFIDAEAARAAAIANGMSVADVPALVRAEMDANSTQLAAIVEDTNELQTDDVPAALAVLQNHGDANWAGGGGPGGPADLSEILPRLKPALPRTNHDEIKLTVGDTYDQDEGRPLEFTPANDCGVEYDGWPDLTDATVNLVLTECPASGDVPATLSTDGSIINATGEQLVRVELTAEQTGALPAGRYKYKLVATLANENIVTLECGTICFCNC